MTVSIDQKVDLLYKQAFGVTKTDNATNKSASNEAIVAPAIVRGDAIWSQSDQIPGIAAGVVDIVSAYTGSQARKCTADNSAVPIGGISPTWKTGLTNWIPAEFGSTYAVKAYICDSGAADPTTGTQIFDSGSGGTGEWYFNYSSGVLNFIGETIPAGLTGSKIIAIVGYRYIGSVGSAALPSNTNIGNINITTSNITSTSGNLNLSAGAGASITATSNVVAPNFIVDPNTGGVYTDNLYYANGSAWDLQEAKGTSGAIQFNDGNNNFGASANLNFDFANSILTVTGNIIASNLTSNSLTNTYVTFAGANGKLVNDANLRFYTGNATLEVTGSGNITNNLTIGNNANIGNNLTITSNLQANNGTILANLSVGTVNINGTAGNISATNVSAANLYGNLTGNLTGNIAAYGSNTQIIYNDAGKMNAAAGLRFYKDTSNLAVDGNLVLANTNISNLNSALFNSGANIKSQGTGNLVVQSASGGNVQIQAPNGSNSSTITAGNGIAQLQIIDGVTVKSAVTVNPANIEINSNNKIWTFSEGDTYGPGSVFANTGLVKASTLEITNTANVTGDAHFAGNITIDATTTSKGNLVVGDGTNTSGLDILKGNLHVGNNATIDGALSVKDLTVTEFVNSSLVPGIDADGTIVAGNPVGYDLGNSTHRWRDLWLSGFTINLGTTTISSGGSNNMVVGNAIIGYGENLPNYTACVGNLYAGFFTTSNNAVFGNVTGNKADILVSGVANINGGNSATSTTSGALKVAGGVGITGNIYVGGNVANITGNLEVNGIGGANIANNLSVGGNVSITGDTTIGGNLTVSGVTTYVNTTNSSIKDAIIDIGGANSGANLSGAAIGDRGLILHNYYTGVENQFIGWNTLNNEFQLLRSVSQDANGNVTGTFANLHLEKVNANHIYGTIETTSQPNIANMSGLFDITVSNVAQVNNATISTLVASSLKYPKSDGTVPQPNEVVALKTDGAGNLSFQIIHTDRIANGTSNVFVNNNGNITLSANSHSNVLIVGDNTVYVNNDLVVANNISANTISTDGLALDFVTVGNTSIRQHTVTTTTTTGTSIAEVPIGNAGNTAIAARGIEFLVKGEEIDGGKYTVASISVIHDGTASGGTVTAPDHVDYAVYAKMHLGGGCGTFTVNYAGGNIQLLATPGSSNTTTWTTQIRTV